MSVATHKTDKTMKKTYITPSMETVKIATQQMLAGSNPSVGIGSGSVEAGSVESRDWDDWDEEYNLNSNYYETNEFTQNISSTVCTHSR